MGLADVRHATSAILTKVPHPAAVVRKWEGGGGQPRRVTSRGRGGVEGGEVAGEVGLGGGSGGSYGAVLVRAVKETSRIGYQGTGEHEC